VLQVRSLANRGEHAAARALLERLLADDPQWQPQRSLREQLHQAPVAAAAEALVSVAPVAAPLAAPVAGFEALLERAAARLASFGGTPVPVAEAEACAPADLDAFAAELAALERRLSDFEARFALA
jgi:hypothetical protein